MRGGGLPIQSILPNVKATKVDNLHLRAYSALTFVLFSPLFFYNKILINYSGHRKFTVSLDVNYDPPLSLSGNHKHAIALITSS